ncbi:NUDIX hydrolase [Streptococcus cristatus]
MRAGVIIYNPFLDKILLIHRWKNGQEYFVIPGGTIELGKGPLEAALREMKEEVNLSFSADQLHSFFPEQSGQRGVLFLHQSKYG